MALLSIYRGTQAEVSERPVSDGALLFATDTKKIYLDKGSSRIEMTSLQDLSDYITSTQLSSAIEAEADARQKQDNLLQDDIDKKLQSDDLVQGSNITLDATSQPGRVVISAIDTNTWTAFEGATPSAVGTAGYVPAPAAGAANRYFRSDGTWTTPPDTNTTYTLAKDGSTITLTGSDGSKTSVTDENTTYTLASFGITATADELNYMTGVTSNVQTQLDDKAALVHTHDEATTSAAGFMPQLSGSASEYLRGDGSWAAATATIADNSITLTKLASDVGTVAVQSSQPSDTNIKLWVQI